MVFQAGKEGKMGLPRVGVQYQALVSPPVGRGLAFLLLAFTFPTVLHAQLAWTTLAGQTAGNDDGSGSQAQFALQQQSGLAVDAAGNVYVGDSMNRRIRRISPAGTVSTVAGSSTAVVDGPGTLAGFGMPAGVAVDSAGNVYVVDRGASRIRIVAPNGAVSTLAGGEYGYADGAGGAAKFRSPWGLAKDNSGNLYVVDQMDNRIRKVTPSGVVSTLAGSGTAGFQDGPAILARFNGPTGAAVDASGFLYVADAGNNRVRRVSPDGLVTTLAGSGVPGSLDGVGIAAQLNYPCGVAVDPSGAVFVADTRNDRIRRITPDGTVTTLAGSSKGFLDASALSAQFNGPTAVAVESSGNVIVLDTNNLTIRKVTPDGAVSTLAGSGPASFFAGGGILDGIGPAARFANPTGVVVDSAGVAYVADQGSNRIRKVTPQGEVTTYAGSGTAGWADGSAGTAQFNQPRDLVLDAQGNLFVADLGNHRIRRITPDGSVTTTAGTGVLGWADGVATKAQFASPSGIAIDSSGNLYVADRDNARIRKISLDGTASTVAGTGTPGFLDGPATAAQLRSPESVAVDVAGNIVFGDEHRLRRVAQDGTVTTLAGSRCGFADGPAISALFCGISSVALDSHGRVYVSDAYNRVRRVDLAGVVATLGGSGMYGGSDGLGTSAEFRGPKGLSVAADGTVYVADSNNNAIRVGHPTSFVDAATIDAPLGRVGEPRQLGTTGDQATAWGWSIVQQPPNSVATLSSMSVRTPTFIPDVAGQYRFRVSASDTSGRQATSDAALFAAPPTTAKVSGDATICAGMTTTIRADLEGVGPWTVTWSDAIVQADVCSSPVTRTVTPATTRMFTVRSVSDILGVGATSGGAVVSVKDFVPSVVITAPSSARPRQAGLVASVRDAGPGATYGWKISNGTIAAGLGTREITFGVGASPQSILSVTVTSGICTASGSWPIWVVRPEAEGLPVINTVAGSGRPLPGRGEAAVVATLGAPNYLAVDSRGNVFFSDQLLQMVLKVDAAGRLWRVAGSGVLGDSPEVERPEDASMAFPEGLAIDRDGALYYADGENFRVRKVWSEGPIETIAGCLECGFYGEGGSAPTVSLMPMGGLTFSAGGELFLIDRRVVRKIDRNGNVWTVAGDAADNVEWHTGFGGDGGPATLASMSRPEGLAFDSRGNLYIADTDNNRIRKVSPDGIITTAVGGGTELPADGLAATEIVLRGPWGIAVDRSDNLLIALRYPGIVLEVRPSGTVRVAAGQPGQTGFSGDGGPAVNAKLLEPTGVAVDGAGNIYIADRGNQRIRRVDPRGQITTIAGGGSSNLGGDGGPATMARLDRPQGVASDGHGSFFVADWLNHVVRKVDVNGRITTIAGTGHAGFSGDGGPAGAAAFNEPFALATDKAGNLFVADSKNGRIRRIDSRGVVMTVAGGGSQGDWTDGCLATTASLRNTVEVKVDEAGNIWIADGQRVLKVDAQGRLWAVAGVRGYGFSGDGGPATSAQLNDPEAVVPDGTGGFYLADTHNDRIRYVDPSGTIRTVIGNGKAGSPADVGPAAEAFLDNPQGLAIGRDGTLYVNQGWGVWYLAKDNSFRRISGSSRGVSGFTGDGGPAIASLHAMPGHIAIDANGDILVPDSRNDRIRRISIRCMASSAEELEFTALSGGQVQSALIQIRNTCLDYLDSTATVSTTDGAPWLTISSASGRAPWTFDVTADPKDLPGGTYTGTVTVTSPGAVGSPTSIPVTLSVKPANPGNRPVSVFVPVVVSSAGASPGSFFTSELTLTNRGTTDATMTYAYTAAAGGTNGTATDTLPAGRQKIVRDAIEYLRGFGVPVGDDGTRVGTVRIDFAGLSSDDAAAVTVRTGTPVPEGRAGLAYAGLGPTELLSAPVFLCGLRQNSLDRANVAVVNAGDPAAGDITLRLTVYSGDPGAPLAQDLPEITLPPGGFQQVTGILSSNGLSVANGFVRVERVAGSAPYFAYGVINDQANSDGSFVEPIAESRSAGASSLTLPALVQTASFSSELVVTNLTSAARTLRCEYVASALTGGRVSFSLSLQPTEQQILPAFVQVLRERGVIKDAPGPAFAGALFVTGDVGGVAIGSRTLAAGGGGRYGVYSAAVPGGSEAKTKAWLFGLQHDAETRTNLSIVNTGAPGSSADSFRIDLFDGATGQKAGAVEDVSVPAQGFAQIGMILSRYAPSVSNGYALVTRTSGDAPFVAYAVLNDGAEPGLRSGDGAFVKAFVPADQ